MLDILDSFIATITFVFILSFIVQSIQQILKQILNLKSKYMARELFFLFHENTNNDIRNQPILRKIINFFTPISFKVYKELRDSPSTKEILNKIKNSISTYGYNDLSLIESMNKMDFEKLLSTLNLDQLKDSSFSKNYSIKKDVYRWFDITMKSFQEHYERRMKFWSYVISTLVVIWLNANLFSIYEEFNENKVFRENAITFGEYFHYSIDDSTNYATFQQIKENAAYLDSLVHMNSFQLMRWNTPKGDLLEFKKNQEWTLYKGWNDIRNAIWNNFFGWVAMIFLVALGAPFWYDFLKTIMGIKDKLKNEKGSNNIKLNGE